MSKTYDKVKWQFLKRTIERMTFCEKWISLIMACIKSFSYSVLVKGEPKGEIKPSRGFRQGDPLCPYLFLIYSKGLNRLIQNAAMADLIKGFCLCRNGPQTTHLFFVDDSLLFYWVEMGDLQAIQNILLVYKTSIGATN